MSRSIYLDQFKTSFIAIAVIAIIGILGSMLQSILWADFSPDFDPVTNSRLFGLYTILKTSWTFIIPCIVALILIILYARNKLRKNVDLVILLAVLATYFVWFFVLRLAFTTFLVFVEFTDILAYTIPVCSLMLFALIGIMTEKKPGTPLK